MLRHTKPDRHERLCCVLECAFLLHPNHQRETKNVSISPQASPPHSPSSRTPCVASRTHCFFFGSACGTSLYDERSCRARAKQAQAQDFAAAIGCNCAERH